MRGHLVATWGMGEYELVGCLVEGEHPVVDEDAKVAVEEPTEVYSRDRVLVPKALRGPETR